MKKAIVVMLLAFLVLNASAQNKKNPSVNEVFVGVRGGVNVASMRFTDKHQSSLDKTNAVNPLIGAFVEMPLNDRFVVAPGISYIERGVKINYTHYSGNEMHYEINSKYLDFRLPVLYKMNVKSLVRPYLVTGAENDMVQTCTGSAVTVPFLDNDTLLNNCSDLYCEIVEQPAHGLATINNNNEMIYTPYDGFDGADQFRYKIKCGVQSDEAWVFVDVGADLVEELTKEQCDSFTWHGQFFDHSVDTTWRKSNEDGCDSVFMLHLTVYKPVTISIDQTVCDSLEWDGNVYYSTCEYTKLYSTMHGCDSIVTVNLTVYKSVERWIDTTVCDSLEWDGVVYDSTGEYPKTYSTMHGCDSIVTLNLTVNPAPEVSIHGPTSIYPVTSIVSGVYDYYIDTTNLVTVPDVQWEIDNDNWLLEPQGARCKLICLSTGSGVLRAWTEGEECDFGTELAIESSFFDVEENEQLLVLIFPNPVKHRLSINSAGVVHVGIYNVSGNLLEELQFDNDNQCIIDMNKYDAGLYLFAITTNMGKVYKTVIKE